MITYNPIIEVTEPKRVRVATPIQAPRPGTALVLDPAVGNLVVIEPGDRVPDARFGKYHRVFVVDTSSYGLMFEVELPSQDASFSFRAKVNFTCAVTDAAAIAVNGVRDMTASLRPSLTKVLRAVAKHHDILDTANAETALNHALDRVPTTTAVRLSGFSVEVDSSHHSEIHRLHAGIRMDDIRRSAMRPVVKGGRDELFAQIMALNNGDPSSMLAHEAAVKANDDLNMLQALDILSDSSDARKEPFDLAGKREAAFKRLTGGSGDLLSDTPKRGLLRPRVAGAIESKPEDNPVVDEQPAERPAEPPKESTSDTPRASRLRGTARRTSESD